MCGFRSAGDYKQAPVPCVLWRQGERRGNTWRILSSFVVKLRFKKERERERKQEVWELSFRKLASSSSLHMLLGALSTDMQGGKRTRCALTCGSTDTEY